MAVGVLPEPPRFKLPMQIMFFLQEYPFEKIYPRKKITNILCLLELIEMI